MAEIVNRKAEEMLPELEQLLRVGLFSSREIKVVIKKRRAHEYKLVRRQKEKRNFLAYVQYDINFLSLIHKRRKSKHYFYKKDEIEYVIVARINNLFKQMSFRWPHDIKIWMSHAHFNIKWKNVTQLNKLSSRFLQIHGGKPLIWILAAKWVMEVDGSSEKTRSIFLRGTHLHPSNEKIWLEYFRAEFLISEKMRRRLEVLVSGNSDFEQSIDECDLNILNGETVKVVFENAIKSISNNLDFYSKFLDISLLFLNISPFASKIMEIIKSHLNEKFDDNFKARAILAKLHLKTEKNSKHGQEKCWNEFERNLTELNTTEMWGEYFDTLLQTYNGNNVDKLEIGRTFFSVSVRAHKEKKLTGSRYAAFVHFCLSTGNVNRALDILNEACQFQKNTELWLKRLEIIISLSIEEFDVNVDINKVALETLPLVSNMKMQEKSRFWCLWMGFNINHNNEDMIMNVLTKYSLKSESNNLMQDLYLKWKAAKDGILETYKVFNDVISKYRTPDFDRYKVMLKLLKSSPVVSHEIMVEFYEKILSSYGLTKPDLWLDYLHYVRRSGYDSGPIYWRAMKNLKPELTESFITNYTLLNIVKE